MRTLWSTVLRASLTVLLAFLLSLRVLNIRAQRMQPYGSYTEQQILARSVPLCRALALDPSSGTLWLSAEREYIWRRGDSQAVWNVQCADARRNDIAMIQWDARTGDLLLASSQWSIPRAAQPAIRNARQAVEAARGWMRALGIGGPETSWRLAGAPTQCGGDAWFTRWRAKGQGATVQM